MAEKREGSDLKFGHYRNTAERPASPSGGKQKAAATKRRSEDGPRRLQNKMTDRGARGTGYELGCA